MRTLRMALAVGLGLSLSGCLALDDAADNLRPVRVAIAAEAKAPVGLWSGGMTVLVGTTREAGDKDTYFSTKRAQDLTVARALLYPPAKTMLASVNPMATSDWTIAGVRPEDKASSATSVDAKSGDADPARTLAAAAEGRDVLLYVHGYNETFATSLVSFAGLVSKMQFTGAPILFSWPSGGAMLDYVYDRESAMWSRDALEETITALAANPKVGRIHILAHSMGGLVTLEALRSIGDRTNGMLAGRFGAIILANPDVDIDLFRRQMARLPYLRSKTTVIISGRDRALEISRRLAGGVARVGSADRSELIATGARVIDATEFESGLFNHDIFMRNDEVTAVLKRAIDDAAP